MESKRRNGKLGKLGMRKAAAAMARGGFLAASAEARTCREPESADFPVTTLVARYF